MTDPSRKAYRAVGEGYRATASIKRDANPLDKAEAVSLTGLDSNILCFTYSGHSNSALLFQFCVIEQKHDIMADETAVFSAMKMPKRPINFVPVQAGEVLMLSGIKCRIMEDGSNTGNWHSDPFPFRSSPLGVDLELQF